MTGDDLTKLLGRPSDDSDVVSFLTAVGITKKPKLKRGEDDVLLKNERSGVEVTFDDERFLNVKSDAYEEGTLVLSNVTLYGPGQGRYKEYQGELPLGLRFDFGRPEIEARLGAGPAWEDNDFGTARWDLAGFCLFVTFDDQTSKIGDLSIQLPVA